MSSALGDVRLFDLRRVTADPNHCVVAKYCQTSHEVTGAAFTHDGQEIVASVLGDHIYLFDTLPNPLFIGPEPMEDGQDVEEGLVHRYKRVFRGHYSISTIKGIGLAGSGSELVASGSDDARVYLWHRHNAELVTVLEGHRGIVNTVVAHPTLPLIASAGLDNHIALWSPTAAPLHSDKERRRRDAYLSDIIEHNAAAYTDEAMDDGDDDVVVEALHNVLHGQGEDAEARRRRMLDMCAQQ